MKRLLCLLLLLACVPALAQTVTLNVPLGNYQVSPATNRAVRVQILNVPTVNSGSVIISDQGIVYSDTNGNVQITNAPNNTLWQFTVLAPPAQTIIKVLVLPGATGTINATNTLAASATATFPAGSVAWAAASSDLRYILATNNLPNGYLAFTTNGGVTFGPASSTLDTTALHQANNLSDVANAQTSAHNIGIFTNLFVWTLGSNILTGGYNVTGVLSLNGTNITGLFVPRVSTTNNSGILISTNGDGSLVISTNGASGGGGGTITAVSAAGGIFTTTNSGAITVATNGMPMVTNNIGGGGIVVSSPTGLSTIATNGWPVVTNANGGDGIVVSTTAGTATFKTNGFPTITNNAAGSGITVVTSAGTSTISTNGSISGNALNATNYQTTNLITFNLGAGKSYTNFGGSHGQLLVPVIAGQPYFYVNTNPASFGLIIVGTNYTDGIAQILTSNQVFYPTQNNVSFYTSAGTTIPVQDQLYQIGPITNFGSWSGIISGLSFLMDGSGITNLAAQSGAALTGAANQFSQSQNFAAGATLQGTVSFASISGNNILAVNGSRQLIASTVAGGLQNTGTTIATNGFPTITNASAGSGVLVSVSSGVATISTNGAPPNITAGSGIIATPSGSTVTLATNGAVPPGITAQFVATNDQRALTLNWINGAAGYINTTNATNQNLNAGAATITNATILGGTAAGITSLTGTVEKMSNSTIQNLLAVLITNLTETVGTGVASNFTILSGALNGINTAAIATANITTANITSNLVGSQIVTLQTNTTGFTGTGTVTNLNATNALVQNILSANDTNLVEVNGRATTTNATTVVLNSFNSILSQLSLYPAASVSLTNGPNPDINSSTNTILNLSGYTAQSGVSGFTGGTNGRIVIIKSENANTLVISNQTLYESTQTNRIITGTGGDVTLTGPMVMAGFEYDATDQRWLLMFVNAGAASPTFPVSIFNGGTGQTTASAALTALGGASLTSSNQWGTNGENFPATVYFTPTNVYSVPGATISYTAFGTAFVGSTGAFASMVTAQHYGNGFQIFIPTNSAGAAINTQFWVRKVTDAQNITAIPIFAQSLTNVSFQIYPPNAIIRDITPNPQANIQSDGTFETACGSLSANAIGGGYYLNDLQDSALLTMFNAGGSIGECYGFETDNNNRGATVMFSALAPAFSIIQYPSGLLSLPIGLTNGSGQLLIANPTLSGTIVVPATNTGPTNILTPARYMAITVGGTNYRVPLYQ